MLKDQLLTLWGFPCILFVVFPLLLLIFFLYLIIGSLICVFTCFSWIYPMWYSLRFLDLINYFLSHIREVFNYNLFKYFLRPFLFLFFFWDPYNSNVVPEVSETVLNSFHSFFFILLCGSYFPYFIFQVTYLLFCLSYSAIDSL